MNSTPPLVGRSVLQALDIIGTLQPEDFDELARKTHIEEYPAGRRLFLRGHHDSWTYYLLDGQIELEWQDGHKRLILGGKVEALAPLAPGQPRQATATTLSRIRFIRIDTTLLDILTHHSGPESYALEEISDEDSLPHNRLFYAVYHDYLSDQIKLPHLPDIVVRVREAVQDPDCDATAVARMIQGDPVLAARLIQAANSPLYGVQTPINSCRAAVMFLGLSTTRDLVLTYTLQHLFQSESGLLRQRMMELWKHSVLVGAISFILAGMTPGIDRERALLAGLLHDIGALPVINYAAQVSELSSNATLLDQAVDALRAQIGAMVLRQWHFGEEMVGILLDAEEWERDPENNADYADVVLIAQLLLRANGDEEQLAHTAQLPAWSKLARGRLDAELAAEVIREAEEDVVEVLQLLK